MLRWVPIALLASLGCASPGGGPAASRPAGETAAAARPAPPDPAAAPPDPAPVPPAPAPSDAGSEPEGSEPPQLTIAAAGDLVPSIRLVASARDYADQGGFHRMLAGYRELLEPDDLVVINVESPLVDDVNALNPGWPPVLGAPPELAAVLDEVGVDVVSLANNHAYDQGHLGIERTLELLGAADVVAVGVGPDLDAAYGHRIVEHQGWRVAFLAACAALNRRASGRGSRTMHVARLWNERRVIAAIAAARAEADLVVLLVHWGADFAPRASGGQERLGRRLIEAGADLILGTGPHLLQRVDRIESERGEAVVAYSLGNLVSSMAFSYRLGRRPRGYVHPANVIPEARDGVLLRVSFARAPEGRLEVASLTGVPLWTLNNYLERAEESDPLDIRVVPLSQARPEVRAERGPRIEAALGPVVTLTPE